MMRKAAAMLFLVLLTLMSATAAFGQAVYGNIVGTVTDPSGAAVPNAKVTITDLGRGISVNTTTNESGNFTQRSLIVGRYQVRIEAHCDFKGRGVLVALPLHGGADPKISELISKREE